MTLSHCRLAPTAGSLKARQGFVSFRRISTYSIKIISRDPPFVKGWKQILRRFYANILLSMLKTSFHLPSISRHVEVMWNLPARSAFSGFSAVVVMT